MSSLRRREVTVSVQVQSLGSSTFASSITFVWLKCRDMAANHTANEILAHRMTTFAESPTGPFLCFPSCLKTHWSIASPIILGIIVSKIAVQASAHLYATHNMGGHDRPCCKDCTNIPHVLTSHSYQEVILNAWNNFTGHAFLILDLSVYNAKCTWLLCENIIMLSTFTYRSDCLAKCCTVWPWHWAHMAGSSWLYSRRHFTG